MGPSLMYSPSALPNLISPQLDRRICQEHSARMPADVRCFATQPGTDETLVPRTGLHVMSRAGDSYRGRRRAAPAAGVIDLGQAHNLVIDRSQVTCPDGPPGVLNPRLRSGCEQRASAPAPAETVGPRLFQRSSRGGFPLPNRSGGVPPSRSDRSPTEG